MITHEEFIKALKNLQFDVCIDYVIQQNAKLEKVSKLLELYKEERSMLERYINGNYQPMGEHLEIIKQIKELEEELK